MSILWGLTGSLDSRIVNDGKTVDVAFDSPTQGKSSGKAVAAVAIKGMINGKSFELLRKKGPKKQELQFILDGKDLTCQAVKDTQSAIDHELGIANGLLQRCFFFGQHSHTSQVSAH